MKHARGGFRQNHLNPGTRKLYCTISNTFLSEARIVGPIEIGCQDVHSEQRQPGGEEHAVQCFLDDWLINAFGLLRPTPTTKGGFASTAALEDFTLEKMFADDLDFIA